MKAEFFKEELRKIREELSKLPTELREHFQIQKKLDFTLRKVGMIGVGKGSTLIAKASLPGAAVEGGER